MTLDAHLAFVFPGQGSQTKGMLFDLSDKFSIIKQTFDEASDILAYDLWELIQVDEFDRLNQTEYTQPALLAASVALWRSWLTLNHVKPQLMAGHSLGEYSALVCANSIDFDVALKLVASRGQLMQRAVPSGVGSMAAILGLSGADVVALCRQVQGGGLVCAANFNSLEQTVIAGHVAAVDEAMVLAKDQGAKRVIKLPVSVPSHCALMREAAISFKEILDSILFRKPEITVLRNIDAQPHEQGDSISQALVQQLYEPVQWVKSIEAFSDYHIQVVIECGPGAVLSGLIKRINSTLSIDSMLKILSRE